VCTVCLAQGSGVIQGGKQKNLECRVSSTKGLGGIKGSQYNNLRCVLGVQHKGLGGIKGSQYNNLECVQGVQPKGRGCIQSGQYNKLDVYRVSSTNIWGYTGWQTQESGVQVVQHKIMGNRLSRARTWVSGCLAQETEIQGV
jgi:hypothetical protein